MENSVEQKKKNENERALSVCMFFLKGEWKQRENSHNNKKKNIRKIAMKWAEQQQSDTRHLKT